MSGHQATPPDLFVISVTGCLRASVIIKILCAQCLLLLHTSGKLPIFHSSKLRRRRQLDSSRALSEENGGELTEAQASLLSVVLFIFIIISIAILINVLVYWRMGVAFHPGQKKARRDSPLSSSGMNTAQTAEYSMKSEPSQKSRNRVEIRYEQPESNTNVKRLQDIDNPGSSRRFSTSFSKRRIPKLKKKPLPPALVFPSLFMLVFKFFGIGLAEVLTGVLVEFSSLSPSLAALTVSGVPDASPTVNDFPTIGNIL